MKKHLPLIAFLTPFLLYFVIPSLVPYETTLLTEQGDAETEIMPGQYLVMTAARVMLMLVSIGVYWRFYLQTFPIRVDHWGLWTGLFGAVVWIGLCHLNLESSLMRLLGLPAELLGARDGIDPFEAYPATDQRTMFLVARFGLLVAAVPIAEELFLRGFFMRVIDAEDWTALPLSEIGATGLVAGTAYGMLTHPSEFLAAAVWFSLVTLLMVKTGKFWNCVLAHAVTNLMLGIYVLMTGTWSLW